VRIRLFDPAVHPRFDDLPWDRDLAEWSDPRLVDLPAGLHRHVVRFIDERGQYYALKELPERLAQREYRLLRTMNDRGLPVVAAVALVDRRASGQAVLVTRYLDYALPYRRLFRTDRSADVSTVLVESLATLLARLHNAGFFWGDASLSNALFRRDSDYLSAFALDTETGELHSRLTAGQRSLDIETAVVNVAGGLCDLAAAGELPEQVDPFDTATRLGESYERIWDEIHGPSTYDPENPMGLEQRLDRLHEMGFDVREAVITTDGDDGGYVFEPSAIEDGYHRRQLLATTGITAREHQARRLVGMIEVFRTELESRRGRRVALEEAGRRWRLEVFDPVIDAVPRDAAMKLERAQLFLELVDHARHAPRDDGGEVDRAGSREHGSDLIDVARHAATTLLDARPDERATPVERS